MTGRIQTSIEADQALAILREAPRPLTATDIGKHVGYAFCGRPDGRLIVRKGMQGEHMKDGLNVLLRDGRVSRARVGHRVYWSYVERPEDDLDDKWDTGVKVLTYED